MDALPVEEAVRLKFKSRNKGVMHACGHDTHVAMLLGAAMLLKKHEKELKGSVKLLFQPAEEDGGRGGALPMIEDGAMEKPHVDYVFGLHISADYPSGTFALRPGPAMAAPDGFRIRVLGKGGHGSQPQNTVDPVFVSAQIILALQGIRSRLIDPTEPFVLSVCSVNSGTKDNIIPDEAVILGTIRTFDKEVRRKAKKLTSDISRSVATAFGAKCEVNFTENAYPVTANDPDCTDKVKRILSGIKDTKTIDSELIMGGEDFSRFLEKAPGVFYFLGTMNKKKGCVYPNHSSKFRVDEDVLKYGALSLAKVAYSYANG
jgi:carboxypeptidase Ss1